MTNQSDSLPCVAHLLRPALGGMREQVRTLLLQSIEVGSPPLLLAPQEILDSLLDVIPHPNRRYPLRTDVIAPQSQIATGQLAGGWAKRSGARLLHGHGLRFAPLFASASLTSGLPLIVTLHNLVPSDLTGMQKAAARAALSRASTVIAVSNAVAASASELIPDSSRIVTIPNGVDLARFAVLEEERVSRRTATRTAFGVTEETPVVLCLSRLSAEKDVSNLIEAVALMTEAMPDVELWVAGEGRLRKTLKTQIELLGVGERVRLLGACGREVIPDLLYSADLFALSSREEGLSLAVLEAMAAGLPVVATNIGGLPEAVADKETGLLVPPRDPARFAEGLAALLTDPARRQAMSKAGLLRAQERFSRDRMVAGTFAAYRRVAHL